MLRLAANRLHSVPATALRSLTQLRSLDLSDNPLTTLHHGLLMAALQLASLNVSGTRLTRLIPGSIRHVADTLRVLDLSRCGQLVAAPDIGALTRLQRLVLPAHICRCDVINFRLVVEDVRSRQRSRPSVFCGATVIAVDVDAICSGSLSPTPAPVKPTATNRPAVQRDIRSDDPLPYDPKLGWYTAAVLSGLLFAFIACVGLEKAEKHLLEVCMARHGNKKHTDHVGQRRQSTRQQQQPPGHEHHQHVRSSVGVCSVADFEVGVDNSYLDEETPAT